jgi:deoxycytidine triphosphate deaminase
LSFTPAAACAADRRRFYFCNQPEAMMMLTKTNTRAVTAALAATGLKRRDTVGILGIMVNSFVVDAEYDSRVPMSVFAIYT